MWTGKIFKKAFIVSCAMFVPFCELMAQDEKVYTAEYKFNYQSKTVTLSVLGNLTLNAPTSVNFNSTEIVEIPVNVTNGVDLIDVTSDDFTITITNGNNAIRNNDLL